MKITEKVLKQLIKEELAKIFEGDDGDVIKGPWGDKPPGSTEDWLDQWDDSLDKLDTEKQRMFDQWQKDPNSVPEKWRKFFEPNVTQLPGRERIAIQPPESGAPGRVVQGPWGDIPALEPQRGRPVSDYMEVAKIFKGDPDAIKDLPVPPGQPKLNVNSTTEEIAAALKYDEDLYWSAKDAPTKKKSGRGTAASLHGKAGDPMNPDARRETLRNVRAMEQRTPELKGKILEHPNVKDRVRASVKKKIAAGAFIGILVWQLLEGLANATETHGHLLDEEGNINEDSVKAHGIELGKFGISAVDPTGIADVGFGIHEILSADDPKYMSEVHGQAMAEMFGIPTPSDAGPEGIKPGSATAPGEVIATVAPDWLEIWNPVGEEEGFTMEWEPGPEDPRMQVRESKKNTRKIKILIK